MPGITAVNANLKRAALKLWQSAEHLGAAAKEAGSSAIIVTKEGLGSAKTAMGKADEFGQKALAANGGNVWGAVKGIARNYPVSTAAVATVGLGATALGARRVIMGPHTARVEQSRQQQSGQQL